MLFTALILLTSIGTTSASLILDEEWNKTFGGSNSDGTYSGQFGGNNLVQQTSDGGYIIAGYTNSYGAGKKDIWLIKTDANGNEEWNRTFGGSDDDEAYSVQQTSDGGYVIAGYTKSFCSGYYDAWLIKTDANGNEVWNKTFGGSDLDWASSVQQTSDGGYIVAGVVNFRALWLMKTDSSGNVEWSKSFSCGWRTNNWASSVQQTSDGGYIVAGYGLNTTGYWDWYDAWLIKTDANGNEEWNRTFGCLYRSSGAHSVQQTSDGGYIVAGWTSCGDGGVLLIKTDSDGNEEWSKIFGISSAIPYANSVQQTSDGSYIIAGSTLHYSISGDSDIWIIKTDSSGNKEWNKKFGGSNEDRGSSVQQTSDGGYIIAGWTNSYGAGQSDVWLIKLAPETMLLPDLALSPSDIAFSNPNPVANEEITITATIHNEGDADANNILIQFYDGDPDGGGTLIGEQVISSITAGGLATAQINWIAQEGTHNIYVVVDPNDEIAESNENNNKASKSLEVTIPLPDLTVSPNDITFSNADPQTTDITFKVTIHNNGEADATNVVVQFFDGDPETRQLIATANIQSIQAGDSSTVETWWDVSCSSTDFSVRIDPDNLIEEENEDNNECTVTSPIGEEQKLLEKLNGVGVFHFYEEFYDYFNDNIPPDDKKSSICSLEDDDIWILYQFPYGLNWMYGDDLTCSLDANLWYSGVDPNGNEPIDVSVDLADFIPSELAEPLHYLECTVRGNGFPTFNPIYYDWDQSRAEILAKPEISAYAAGLPKIYASGNVYLYYNPYTDALEFERDFDQINAGTTLRINEYSIPFDEKLFIFNTFGQIDIGLDANLRGGFKFGESLVPKAVVPSGRAEEDVSGEINLVVEDLGIFDYPPYMEATITPINTPHIMLEGAIATEDFQSGESITSPFESNVEYRNLKAWEPVGRVKLSEIAVDVAGTIYYDLVGPIPPATYDFDFTLNLIPGGEFTIGNTEIIVHSPVNIHVYDERGRHVGINEFGNVEEEIPNSTYLEDAGKKVIRIPSLVDRFIVMVEGTGEGKYNLSISKPLLIDIDGNETITYITFNFNNITTSKGDRDYFDIDTQKIIREIKDRLKDKSIDEAIEEVVTTTDFDHDGIPDIKDTNMQFERRVVTLLAPNVEAQPNSSVRLTSRLIYLDKPIPSKEIDFKLDGKDIGSSTTNVEGIAYLDYPLKNESIGIHEITIVFEGDEEYGNATVNALLNIIDKPPEVEITSPNNYERVSGKITIDGNVSDTNLNLESISLIIDGTEVSKSLPFEWNTTKYQHGPHIIQLFAIDGSGNKGTDAVVVFVNQPPVADANGPYTGIEGQPIQFNASLSYDPEGMPLTYYWNFGDEETAVTTQPTITHIYAQEGNYTVMLIVNDSVQNSTPSITYALINDTEPKANFTANVTSGFAPLTVQFNDLSQSYDGIIAWEWDFNGDGIVDSNEQNPTHTYDEAGTYTVSLTVYEADGDSDTETKTDYITVTSAVDTEPPLSLIHI